MTWFSAGHRARELGHDWRGHFPYLQRKLFILFGLQNEWR